MEKSSLTFYSLRIMAPTFCSCVGCLGCTRCAGWVDCSNGGMKKSTGHCTAERVPNYKHIGPKCSSCLEAARAAAAAAAAASTGMPPPSTTPVAVAAAVTATNVAAAAYHSTPALCTTTTTTAMTILANAASNAASNDAPPANTASQWHELVPASGTSTSVAAQLATTADASLPLAIATEITAAPPSQKSILANAATSESTLSGTAQLVDAAHAVSSNFVAAGAKRAHDGAREGSEGSFGEGADGGGDERGEGDGGGGRRISHPPAKKNMVRSLSGLEKSMSQNVIVLGGALHGLTCAHNPLSRTRAPSHATLTSPPALVWRHTMRVSPAHSNAGVQAAKDELRPHLVPLVNTSEQMHKDELDAKERARVEKEPTTREFLPPNKSALFENSALRKAAEVYHPVPHRTSPHLTSSPPHLLTTH